MTTQAPVRPDFYDGPIPVFVADGAELLRPPPPGSHYDAAKADRAFRFINNLTHTKAEWAGKPFLLRFWQERVIRTIFGLVWDDTGYRVIRTVYMEIPRKNGKSELAAAIALYLLIADREPGAEIYSAAVDRDQASLVFNVAAAVVRHDHELASQCRIIDSRRNITHSRSGSFYRAIPSEAAGRHGYNAQGIIYDEIHGAPNRDLYDVLTTSTGARRQPLTFVITTAGWDRTSICWELHEYAQRVRDGAVDDPTFLSILYAAPLEADWTDEEVWRACNPALGDFRSIEEMRAFCERAKAVPGLQNTFRRLYLNQWTEQATRWLDIADWDECPNEDTDVKGRMSFGGLDLSTTTDLAAWVRYFPNADTPGGKVRAHFWLPEENLHSERRSREEAIILAQCVDAGVLTLTPGNIIDYDRIRATIQSDGEEGEIKEIAVDRWNATQITTQLMGDGFTMVPFGQGFASMTAPCKELEKLVIGHNLDHGGNPLLRWMASNVAVQMDAAENIKPVKDKSSGRIDGIVALVMALGRAMVNDEAPVLMETRGFLSL